MNHNTSRIIIETMVCKAIKDMKDSPKRSTRNLVDMALQFSEGRFQQKFFEVAQTMLKNANSPYYDLVQDIAVHVDSEKIMRFGINVGYNGCTVGAKMIREIEEREKYNIPWMISLHLCPQQFLIHQAKYHTMISKGEEIGIYTWMLLPEGQPYEVLPLVQQHPNSAFALFCTPKEITMSFLDDVSELNNLMLVVRYDEEAQDTCELLRKMGLLYSVYDIYTEADVEAITRGDLFCGTEQLHPVFTVLLADEECPDMARQEVYQYVRLVRDKQEFQTIVWEATCDNSFVDSIISEEPCLSGFDADGYLFTELEHKKESFFNLLKNDLPQILKKAFPKGYTDNTMAKNKKDKK